MSGCGVLLSVLAYRRLFLEVIKPPVQLTKYELQVYHGYRFSPLRGWGWYGQPSVCLWEAEGEEHDF